MRKVLKIIMLLAVLISVISTGNAQKCYDGNRPHKPYLDIWGYPRHIDLHLKYLEKGSPWHFGFSVGLNVFDFTQITPSGTAVFIKNQGNVVLRADLVSPRPGFNINAIIDYRLLPNLNLRTLPGIFFGSRRLEYYRDDTQSHLFSMLIASNYLEFPLLLKYSASRYSNFRPYIFGGGNLRFNLTGNAKADSERYVGLKPIEPFAELGFGFDFYFEYFRLSTEVKVSKGLVNTLNDQRVPNYEYFRDGLKSMNSNMLVISLHFEG